MHHHIHTSSQYLAHILFSMQCIVSQKMSSLNEYDEYAYLYMRRLTRLLGGVYFNIAYEIYYIKDNHFQN